MSKPTNSDVHALLRVYFPAFVEKVFETLHPGQKFNDNWHIAAICHALTCVAAGDNRRLMINVPPRTLKSIIASIAWPAFLLGHNPAIQTMVVSHNLELATELANKFRLIVDSAWFKAAFPTMSGKPQKDNERVFLTSQGGKRTAISVNGSVTGMGADIIILDDPLDAAAAATEMACTKVNHWIDSSLSTRLNDPPTGRMVLVMQRLSINDPSAHLQVAENWHRLALPAIADIDMEIPINETGTHLFSKGMLLDPIRLSKAFLDTQRIKMGNTAFLAQYQQQPIPDGGGEIDVGLFQRYKSVPKEYDARFLSVDAASGSQSGSYSVIQVFQITDGRLYLCGSQRGFWPFQNLVNYVKITQEKTGANFIVIEKASSGFALLEVLWDHYPVDIRSKLVQKWIPKYSKEVRMSKAMVTVEAKKVFLPENTDWLPNLINELQAFPEGINDDQVDALSQAIEFFNRFLKSHYNPNRKSVARVLTSW